MQYKIALCDDSESDRDYVLAMVKCWAADKGHVIHADAFPSAESFLFHYAEKGDYDILFLDIKMGAMDGLTMAKKLRQDNEIVQIVFITGFADYIADGYEVSALHYLMKPVNRDKLFAVLDRAVAALQKTEKSILLPIGGETLRLSTSRIQYVESFSHNAAIVTETDILQVKMPISELAKLLGEAFIRCHRSYLVNLEHIARLSRTEVFLDSNKTLPLSRSAAPLVHKAFVSYYTGDEHETL